MGESAQKILSRVRPPRVQITYDVEIGDAIEKKTLPFIVGILADLAGEVEPKVEPGLKAREFIQLDRDNFDGIMKSLAAKFTLKDVKNVIPDETIAFLPVIEGTPSAKLLSIPLTLTEMGNLSPVSLAQNIGHINLAFQTQNRLQDLLGKMDGNDSLINLLEKILKNEQDDNSEDEFAKADKVDVLVKEFEAAVLSKLLTKEELKSDEFKLSGFDGKETLINLLMPIDYVANDGRAPFVDDSEANGSLAYKVYESKLAIQKAAWKNFDPKGNVVISRLLDSKGGSMILEDHQKAYAYQLICQFTLDILKNVTDENKTLDVATLIVKKVDAIKKAINDQLNEVVHHATFQKVEAAWRGLHHLVFSSETSTTLKLKLLIVSEDELTNDLKKAVEFDQSALFKKVYENEYGTYGGEPFSMLVVDYEFGRSPAQMEFLEKLSALAAQAHTPLIAPAGSKLFDMNDFTDLAKPRDLSKIFESAELVKWRSFRDSEDSRYVTLTLPKVMLRYPYGNETIPAENIEFEEAVDGSDASKYLWGNSAYFLAERITHAFAKYGWTAAIRGVEGGGLVEGLPTHIITTKDGDKTVRCPTQIAITDRREKELNDLGFVSLCHRKGWDQAAFFGGQTANKPTKYNTDSANMNASVSAMLPYMLNASRFAHYIKVIMREKVGSFQTRSSIEEYLNTWITQYVLLDESAGQESKAAFPLQQGRVVVTEVPGRPGVYKAVVFLRPHFQLEELSASIRLVADIPS